MWVCISVFWQIYVWTFLVRLTGRTRKDADGIEFLIGGLLVTGAFVCPASYIIDGYFIYMKQFQLYNQILYLVQDNTLANHLSIQIASSLVFLTIGILLMGISILYIIVSSIVMTVYVVSLTFWMSLMKTLW